MKRIIISCFIGFFLLSLITSPGYSQTVEKILEKMIEAQGGRKALEAVKDTTLSGSMEMVQMSTSGSLTMYMKEPDKMRMDIELMGMMMTQAYDGKTAWGIDPETGNAKEMPEKAAAEAKRQALGYTVFLNPKKFGITYTFKGKEKINEKQYLVLEQTFADGHKATIYVDAKTYLVYKTKSTNLNQVEAEVESESFESDYKKVEGVMVAHSIVIFQDGQEFLRLTVSEVSFNSDLEDSLFKMDN